MHFPASLNSSSSNPRSSLTSASQYRRSLGKSVNEVVENMNRGGGYKPNFADRTRDLRDVNDELERRLKLDAPTKPRSKDKVPVNNTLIAAGRPMATALPTHQQQQHRTSSRKASLGLSYGPVVSCMEDASGGGRRRTVGGPAGSTTTRHMAVQPASVWDGVHLNGSIESSWRQQVDAASARVATRPSGEIN
jgi:hypothetical protein